MLSKEQKLKYGEILRQQMKEKQQKKKNQDFAKRGQQPTYIVPKSQSDRIVLADPGLLYSDPKDNYVKKLENQDYNPFGKSGGGAPNRKLQQNNLYPSQNSPSIVGKMPYSISGNKSGNYHNSHSGQIFNQQKQNLNNAHQIYNVPTVKTHLQVPYQHTIQHHHPQQFQESIGYQDPRIGNYAENNPHYYQEHYQKRPEQQFAPNRKIPTESYNNYENNQPQYDYRIQQRPLSIVPPQKIPQHVEYHERQRVKTLENEDMQQMYKRGGRNLLKLQNETMNQHLVKQKQKLQMQAFLKQQMQEAERRKQLQKQKIKQQQLEQERRNKQYIQEQNRKLRQQQKRKNDERQRNIDENLRNVQKRKQLEQQAKAKLQKQRKFAIENQRKKQQMIKQQNIPVRQSPVRMESKLNKYIQQDSSSQINSTSSQNPTYGNGFNTKVSKEFFQKQRQREPQKYKNDKKIQLFTAQIQKIRHEINNQGQIFQKQIQKIKKQADIAQSQKMRAELQIQKLKLQLQKKNKEAELKLYDALKRNNPYDNNNRNSHKPQVQNYDSLSQFTDYEPISKPHHNQKQLPPQSPKMPKHNKVYEHYQVQKKKMPIKQSSQSIKYHNNNYQPPNLNDSLAMTLDGESKKIPISLPANSKLTLSNIGNYGKEEFMFSGNISKPKPSRIYDNQFISQQQQDLNAHSRIKSRKNNRKQLQQLDKLVENKKSKWQMSTVNDDITKQIEDLLKKKDAYSNSNTNDYNKVSQAGRNNVSRGAIPYEGPNLNSLNSYKTSTVSYNGAGTIGTVDIDKLYDKNQARLRQLKSLGVETINTNNDEDLNRLNDLLKNYH